LKSVILWIVLNVPWQSVFDLVLVAALVALKNKVNRLSRHIDYNNKQKTAEER
jgi:hypothetical protein